MKENEGVTEFISRVETVANQLSKNGEPLPANRVVEKILKPLTMKMNPDDREYEPYKNCMSLLNRYMLFVFWQVLRT